MRHIRQEIFSEIGKKGQLKLRNSSVAIVGLGALGSVSAELLARAGIGKLILIDRDVVELSNLQRQSLYDEDDLGKPKSMAAKEKLSKINHEVKIEFFIGDLSYKTIDKILKKNKISLILDCTDNLETRFLINDFSVKNNLPFIYSSAVGSKGYVFNIMPGETACLGCFIKELTSLDDIWKNELMKIKINKNEKCECCKKKNFEYLSGKKSSRIIKLCGNNIYQIKSKSMNKKQFGSLKNKLSKIGRLVDFSYCISFENKITIFEDGRALVKAKGEKEAKSLYSRFVGN